MKILTFTFSVLLFFTGVSSASAETYGYIDTSGALQLVTAENPTMAMALAQNIAYDSGVMVMSAKGLALIEENTVTIEATVGAIDYTVLED